MSEATTAQPTRSHPTHYNVSVTIPAPTDAEIGLIHTLELKTFGHNINDGRMMAGTADLFLPTAVLVAAVFHAKGIDKKHREFIALRTAKLLNCPYPWNLNVRLAQNTGASPAEIEALTIDGPVTELDEESNLILRCVDEITMTGTLTDDTLSQMRARYSDEICRKYVLIFSWFNLFGRFCNGCRIPIETQNEVVEQIGNRKSPV